MALYSLICIEIKFVSIAYNNEIEKRKRKSTHVTIKPPWHSFPIKLGHCVHMAMVHGVLRASFHVGRPPTRY